MNRALNADQIQRELAELRASLSFEAQSAAADARTLADWQYHYRSHPWVWCGAGIVLGWAVVPWRSKGAAPASRDPEPMRKVVESAADGAQKGVSVKPGMLGTAAGLLASFVAKQSMAYMTQKGKDYLEKRVDEYRAAAGGRAHGHQQEVNS